MKENEKKVKQLNDLKDKISDKEIKQSIDKKLEYVNKPFSK